MTVSGALLNRSLSRCGLLLLALMFFLVIGCGKSKPVGTVQGTVTFDGTPYTEAAVIFLSLTTGQGGTADIQSDGAFKITTPLPVDTYRVYLAPKLGAPTGEAQPVRIDQSIPDKYWNEAATDISIDIAEGPNTVEVRLQK
jgi:hypothetical protein